VNFAIFVDLARPLDRDEQTRLTDALDIIGGGAVGPRRGGVWEVFFSLPAKDVRAAEDLGKKAIDHALMRCGISLGYSVHAQPMLSG
jgi:hypothetical protein